MQGNGSVGLQHFSVESGENADVVVGSGRGANDAVIGIDHFVELTNNERDTLDAADFFLGAEELAL